MTKVIELTRQVEEAAIAYGNAKGLVNKEAAAEILATLREELEHEIRRTNR